VSVFRAGAGTTSLHREQSSAKTAYLWGPAQGRRKHGNIIRQTEKGVILLKNRNLELIDLGNEIENSDGWKITNKIFNLGTSHYIYMGNHSQLKQALEIFNNPKVTTEIWAVKNREMLREYQKEVIRLLHNYLASAKSLVEHTRIFARDMYGETDFFKEYEGMIEETFSKSPLARFIQDFRNYILHKGLPITSATLSFSENNGMNSYIKVNIEELKKWEKWSAKSKEYLESLHLEINLEQIVTSYTEKVSSFYEWFGKRQEEIHSKEINELHKLQDEYKKLLEKLGFDKSIG